MIRQTRYGVEKRALVTGCVILLGGLLSACGGMDRQPGGPGAVTPPTMPATPTPAPVEGRAGHLHVLQTPWVMNYEIDPTGRLGPPVTQTLGNDGIALAGEPQGRLVYASHGGWSTQYGGPVGGLDLTVSSYSPDPQLGTLAEISHA